MDSWFNIPQPEVSWLVDGLIPSDGHTAICGKPKAGKSLFSRNLIASVIKGGQFLGRAIEIPAGTGRVLYIHLDRKDQDWRVSKDLRLLGIAEKEAERVIFRTAQDVPSGSFEERLSWLQKQVIAAKPHLVVIDLMWQFVVAKNSNDYNAVLNGINSLQDALTNAKYRGALVVTLHGRKATNPNDPADDVLGSTGQRGSFSTNILLARHRALGRYTVMSDQTERDDALGEIDETVIIRNADGTLALGEKVSTLAKLEKRTRADEASHKILRFITDNPGSDMDQMTGGLGMSKATVLSCLGTMAALWATEGEGVKGSPYRYYPVAPQADPKAEATALVTDWRKR
jgi:hypothetical protein